MKLFLFECKKVLKKKTTRILLILSMLAVVGIYFFNLSIANNVEKQVVNQYDFLINLYLGDIEDAAQEKELAIEMEDDALLEEATMFEESAVMSHEKYLELKEDYLNGEWDSIYQDMLYYLEYAAYPEPHGEVYSISYEEQEISNFTLRASYDQIDYLMKHQIDPLVQNTTTSMFLPTIYDNFSGNALELWEKDTSRYGKEGFYFIYQLVPLLYIPIIILIGSFIFGNTLSSETNRKMNTFRFHQVLPINRTRLFFAKYITGYFGVLLFIILMVAVPLLAGTFMHGLGNLDYPVLVYDGYSTEYMERNVVEDTFQFITLKEYLLQTFLFTIVLSVFIYTLYFLVSQFIKEPIFNLVIVGALVILGGLITHPYNPFSYVDIDPVLSHEIQMLHENTAFTLTTGIAVTLVISLILIVVNYIFFRARAR